MTARWTLVLALSSVLALMGGSGQTSAEISQSGTLRVSFAGKLSPKRLPRRGLAPIAVAVSGRITTTDGTLAPQLRTLRIELNRHGRLDTGGLPICHARQIYPASTKRALAACRSALVGRGSFSVDVVLAGQDPYPTTGRLLVFNGVHEGRPALLGQIHSAKPFATSFVIPFRISRVRRGSYGISLTASLPAALGNWGHVTGLQLRLSRKYRYRGRGHSLISAGCPAPEGFPGAIFPLARTTLGFAGGRTLVSKLTESCQAR